MTGPTSPQLRPRLLPPDVFRTVLAALITLLTIGGWINALGRTPLRDALRAQTRLWRIEQIVGLALALVWIEFIDGQLRIPVALILYLLFLWRLLLTRRQVDTRWEAEAPIAQSPPG